jgi:hypothetical protein
MVETRKRRFGRLSWTLPAILVVIGAIYWYPNAAGDQPGPVQFQTFGEECVKCAQPPQNCVPNCCANYVQIYISSVRVTGVNSTDGKTATVSWTDTPSTASDQFFYGTGGVYNLSKTPTNHQVSLSGLSPYVQVNFKINAYHAIDPPYYCYLSAQYYGTFTPYNPHAVSFTYRLFNDTGYSSLLGSTLHDGSVISLYSPSSSTVAYTADPTAPAVQFASWMSDAATFASRSSVSTTISVFTAATSGTFVSELSLPSSGGEGGSSFGGWTGYLQSATQVRNVSFNFTIPNLSWTTPNPLYSNDNEGITAWIGIGGFDYTPTNGCPLGGCFWQAGVQVYLASSTSQPTVRFFVEAPGDDPVTSDLGGTLHYSGGDIQFLCQSCSTSVPALTTYTPAVGDSVSIYLNYTWDSYYGGKGHFYFYDWAHVGGLVKGPWPSGGLTTFWPVRYGTIPTTADWVIEDPVQASAGLTDVIPNFGNLSITQMTLNRPYGSTQYVGYLGPMLVESYCISPWLGGSSYSHETMMPSQPLAGIGGAFLFYDVFAQQTYGYSC